MQSQSGDCMVEGKRRSGSKSRKNDHEAKTYQFWTHLRLILASSWGTWEAFRDHFGCLGANLSQHKAILSHLGANLRPLGANMSPTWSNISQHGDPKPSWMALKRCDTHRSFTTKPQLSHGYSTTHQLLVPGPPWGRIIGGGKPLLNKGLISVISLRLGPEARRI